MLKRHSCSGCSVLAEIVRNSLTGRGDLSELYISTLVKSYNSSEERIISFERTKTNHDKLPRENDSLNNNASNYIAHNLHKLSSCVF